MREEIDPGLAALAAKFAECFAQHDAAAAAKSVESRHVATLGAIFTALAHGDFDTAFTYLTPDTSYMLTAAGPICFQMAGEGRSAVQDGMRTNFGAVAYDEIAVDTLVAQGDVIVIIARQRGRWRASGVAFDERIMLEYLFAGEQVKRYRGWILSGAA
ncbi:MAG: nuclear transport factor 2 family protein [Deltaproteobacteria bacterium]|nr:nuclear transport factor 2 family protein [Deltaproteobacteria bacterium]